MKVNIPAYVEKIIDRLEGAGYEAYIVGGSLRDIIIGKEPYDFDVTTSAMPDTTLSLFSDMRTIPTGLHHGTVTVMCEGNPVEITTFRTDGEYLDSRHPESVSFTRDIKEDLSRRDFTMNAIAYNKNRGFVDPFGGAEDIKNGIIRAVGEPDLRMKEDALRIMRAFRFAAQLGFSIEESTAKALVDRESGLLSISRERIGAEMQKLVCARHAKEALSLMLDTGISRHVFGDYSPSPASLDTLSSLPENDVERFAALLWECEEAQAEKTLGALKYSNALRHAVISIISTRELPLPESDADLRRFIIRLGDNAEAAARVREAVCGASSLSVEAIKDMRKTNFCESISDLALDGNDLIGLGISGKKIGKTLSYLFSLVTDEPAKNDKNELIRLAKQLMLNR